MGLHQFNYFFALKQAKKELSSPGSEEVTLEWLSLITSLFVGLDINQSVPHASEVGAVVVRSHLVPVG